MSRDLGGHLEAGIVPPSWLLMLQSWPCGGAFLLCLLGVGSSRLCFLSCRQCAVNLALASAAFCVVTSLIFFLFVRSCLEGRLCIFSTLFYFNVTSYVKTNTWYSGCTWWLKRILILLSVLLCVSVELSKWWCPLSRHAGMTHSCPVCGGPLAPEGCGGTCPSWFLVFLQEAMTSDHTGVAERGTVSHAAPKDRKRRIAEQRALESVGFRGDHKERSRAGQTRYPPIPHRDRVLKPPSVFLMESIALVTYSTWTE